MVCFSNTCILGAVSNDAIVGRYLDNYVVFRLELDKISPVVTNSRLACGLALL